jgi:hypothetical protein
MKNPPKQTAGWSTAVLTAVLRRRDLGASDIGSGQQGSSAVLIRGELDQGLFERKDSRVSRLLDTTAVNPTASTRWTGWSSVADFPRRKRIVSKKIV